MKKIVALLVTLLVILIAGNTAMLVELSATRSQLETLQGDIERLEMSIDSTNMVVGESQIGITDIKEAVFPLELQLDNLGEMPFLIREIYEEVEIMSDILKYGRVIYE